MTWTSDSCSFSGSGCRGPAESLVASSFRVSLLFAESLLRRAFSMSSEVVELKNAMRLLSGAHARPDAPLGRSVIIQASPPREGQHSDLRRLGFPRFVFVTSADKSDVL